MLLATGGTAAYAGDSTIADRITDALQIMADLTLLDSTCKDVVIDFGVGFRFAADRGVAETSIMPGGPLRGEFESALRLRQAGFSRDELCGQVARNYDEALPGSVAFPFHKAGDDH